MGSYLRPVVMEEALAALAAGPRIVLAGGTDYYPSRVGQPLDDDLLDITALAALRGIVDAGDHWRIPALVTWSELIAADLPPLFDGLKLAAREIGGAQIQNTATVCGNLCNASPAADGIPNLLAIDARVEMSSTHGHRVLPVAEFVLGNRKTAREPHQLVTAICVPKPALPARSTFLKLGARRYLVISIVMVAAVVETNSDGMVAAARVSVGSCSAAALRLPMVESALIGQRLAPALADRVTAELLAPLSPIDDIRGTVVYRRAAALTLVRRAVAALAVPRP
ncbi:MAG TPA: FAD binding domain-containing protein [Alphaproteobacteria bacterium]|nr:FAD binding domain-containing protein [Alphaproteobacteria bacterium]